MQEQGEQVEEINIGILKVPLSPIGNVSFVSNSVQKNNIHKPILHAQLLSLNNGKYADPHVYPVSAKSTSGLLRGRELVALPRCHWAARSRWSADAACSQPQPGRVGWPTTAAAPDSGQ
jgi:hypothetical protein